MKRGASFLAIIILILHFSSIFSLQAQQLLNSPVSLIAPSVENTVVTQISALTSQRPLLRELILQSGVLATLSRDKQYTFFAPTEAALKELQYESAEKLQTIMQHHIIPGRYLLQDLKDGAVLPTLAGDSLTVMRKFKAASINSIPISNSHETASNMVMHIIEDVLKPKKLE